MDHHISLQKNSKNNRSKIFFQLHSSGNLGILEIIFCNTEIKTSEEMKNEIISPCLNPNSLPPYKFSISQSLT